MLLILAENFGTCRDNRIMINLKVSQQMLSNLLGINRITTVKIIKEMNDLELIEQVNGFYCIRDIKKLRHYKQLAGAVGE
ncbi:MAG: winged helix-turn-helix domain-containing protein [Peptococcaceae bacterium]|nr:winged helix-turn-helix domain-containing protein [Peptococcaceae bacterium]